MLQAVSEVVLDTLRVVLQHDRGSPLAANAAAALGWLATGYPEGLSPARGGYLGDWCASLRNMPDDREKEAAFGGLLNIMMKFKG